MEPCGQESAPVCEERAGKELAVLLLVEPGALDVEEPEAGDAARERERVDRELRDWLVGASVRLVVEMCTAPFLTCRKSI